MFRSFQLLSCQLLLRDLFALKEIRYEQIEETMSRPFVSVV
jgi:hypothetical protein